MTPATRTKYFQLWGAACLGQGWSAKDNARRNATTAKCMEEIRGPQTDSTTELGQDEVTALFCYLEFLAHPDSLDHSARWVDCKTDYKAYNRARQADWHEVKTYGVAGSKKLARDRFNGERSASGEPLDKFNPEAIRKRHLTMATRHQKKERDEKAKAAPAEETPSRYLRVIDECRALVATLKDQHPDSSEYSYVVDTYLDTLARQLCYKKAELCSDTELATIKAELIRQIEQAEKAIQIEAARVANDEPF